MVCTQCGHDNPTTAKFCNECGNLIDRRKGERRHGDRRKGNLRLVEQEGVASRQPSPLPSLTPGQENAQGLTPARQAAEAFLRKDRPVRGSEQPPVEDARENGAPAHTPRAQTRPSMPVSGPSFLGLADNSGSADYLLEDESHNGWRKWAVLLLLLLIGILVYMQWKTNWRAQPASPPPPAQSAPSQNQPQGSAAPASETTGVPPAQQASTQPQSVPAQPPASQDAAAAPAGKPKSEDTAPADQSAGKKDDSAAEEQSDRSDQQAPAESEHKSRAPIAQSRKPAAERAAARSPQPDPMVLMAQKYLYGQGVRRDCDQAMVYLRAANQKASVAARSQMGALYATGYCVPLDRIRAYQWFTSALNVEPDNPVLQRERNNLWTQMSSDERQQAVK